MPIEIVSSDQAGNEGNSESLVFSPGGGSVSADGRYVVFYTSSSNLVAGDTNATADVFRKDTATGTVTRISTTAAGAQGNGPAGNSAITADGRYVTFASYASNLVAGDTNNTVDIFLKDTVTGALSIVSQTATGTPGNSDSANASISNDGRYIAFSSLASNLGPGDTNGQYDTYLKNTQTGAISLVSTSANGTQAAGISADPSISADGRYVAFWSSAPNLVPDDTNGLWDVFVKDTLTGAITRVSTNAAGSQATGLFDASLDASISANGRYVAFKSDVSNLVANDTNGEYDIFVKDTLTGSLTRVTAAADGTQANHQSNSPTISADGRYVAFDSMASNLVAGDTNGVNDVFIKDTVTGAIVRLSSPGNGHSFLPSISDDGRFVTFESYATNLVPGDQNSRRDVFIVSNPLVSSSGPNTTNLIVGTVLNDTLQGSSGDDVIIGNGGADVLDGGAGLDILSYASSGEAVAVSLATGTASGGDAVGDTFTGFEGIAGGSGADVLVGSSAANELIGNGGNDYLYTAAGDDAAYGGAGIDVVLGEDGNDTLFGGDATDYIYGGVGTNIIHGDAGVDVLYSGGVNDILFGGADSDYFYAFPGAVAPTAYGGDGNDIYTDLAGGAGANDLFFGEAGNDYFYGFGGNDTAFGGDGVDVFLGGAGNDTFDGGAGTDYAWGEAGNDTFVTRSTNGYLVVSDFAAGGSEDAVRVSGTQFTSFAQVQGALTYYGGLNTTIFTVDGDTSVWFVGVTAGSLTADDFIF